MASGTIKQIETGEPFTPGGIVASSLVSNYIVTQSGHVVTVMVEFTPTQAGFQTLLTGLPKPASGSDYNFWANLFSGAPTDDWVKVTADGKINNYGYSGQLYKATATAVYICE